ncbi:methyltransferase domain-containing protein [Pseudomonas abietaniphila]|uniref:class I SAM-dependent methyltransferase n=1 Tax=Pseudomonas abietaniphila TaxID=89065 RepID=UPI0032175E41
MNDESNPVRDHYQADALSEDLVARVQRMLSELGDGPLTHQQLASFDQFHSGGLKATADFIAMLNIKPGMKVLDAGSGLGGPSRFTAQTYDCHVTGVDLTDSFVAVAQLLSQRTGMARQVDYQVGNLCGLTLADEQFDAAYTQHVVMNISDRETAYREVFRVLKPGSRFGFFDVLAVDDGLEPFYPVPWAERSEQSFLLTESETRAVLADSGFAIDHWSDVTNDIVQWIENIRLPSMDMPQAGPSLKLAMGDRFALMAENFARSLRQGRARLVMAVCVKQS